MRFWTVVYNTNTSNTSVALTLLPPDTEVTYATTAAKTNHIDKVGLPDLPSADFDNKTPSLRTISARSPQPCPYFSNSALAPSVVSMVGSNCALVSSS